MRIMRTFVTYVNDDDWRGEESSLIVLLFFPDDFERGKINETDKFPALEETLF